MRIKRNYLAPIKRFSGWAISRFKPFSIHTEMIMEDEVWEIAKQKAKKGEIKVWHVMTPANFPYYLANFGIKSEKIEISKKMKERYSWLLQNKQNLQLHIHLSQTMKTLTYEDQKSLFVEALNWMKKELNLTPTEFVPGWFSYNKDTLKLCKKYNLKMIYERDYDYGHDYEWVI